MLFDQSAIRLFQPRTNIWFPVMSPSACVRESISAVLAVAQRSDGIFLKCPQWKSMAKKRVMKPDRGGTPISGASRRYNQSEEEAADRRGHMTNRERNRAKEAADTRQRTGERRPGRYITVSGYTDRLRPQIHHLCPGLNTRREGRGRWVTTADHLGKPQQPPARLARGPRVTDKDKVTEVTLNAGARCC